MNRIYEKTEEILDILGGSEGTTDIAKFSPVESDKNSGVEATDSEYTETYQDARRMCENPHICICRVRRGEYPKEEYSHEYKYCECSHKWPNFKRFMVFTSHSVTHIPDHHPGDSDCESRSCSPHECDPDVVEYDIYYDPDEDDSEAFFDLTDTREEDKIDLEEEVKTQKCSTPVNDMT